MALELTRSEIADYLLRTAFSTTRTDASNRQSVATTPADIIRTTTLTQTLKLLGGSSDSLDKVQSNLKEMKEIAAGITSTADESERKEAYAKLRSLASGMDDILGAITFDKNALFDGSQLNLSSAGQYNRASLSDLRTTSDKVGLATQQAGADIKVSYDEFCKWNNTLVGVKGLDISNAEGCEITAGDTELEDGNYRLKVSYAGAKSTVTVLDNDGTVLSEEENVDLSGSGVTTVELDCGVKVNFDKKMIEGSIVDKYDYANKGPAVLYADLTYKRVNEYDLSGSQEATDRSMKTIFTQKKETDSSGGTFAIGGMGLGVLEDGQDEIDSGTYKVEVYKIKGNVSAIMYDNQGMVVGTCNDVILNENGTTSIDFGNGVAMTVNDKNFSGNTTLISTFEYTQSVNAYDGFDFEEYSKTIDGAIKAVTEQQDMLNEAYALSSTVSQALNGTLSSNVYSTSSLLMSSLFGGSSTSAMSLLSGSSSANTGLAWASSLITSNLSSALGLSSRSGTSLGSLISGNVTSLNPVTLPTNVKVTT